MVDVKNKRCIYEGCQKHPVYNVLGKKRPLYCASHKTDGMVNVIHPSCKSDWCQTLVTQKYEGYCLFCYIRIFPDKPVSRNYKTKERAVAEHIIAVFPNLLWILDKRIAGGCSRRRPDILLDLDHQVVIVEIDENQHKDYDSSCETKRMMELSLDLDCKPVVFIRFNPDDYLSNGRNITSCWAINGNGLCVVKKSKRDEWTQRLQALEEQIHYWKDPENCIDKTVEIVQLFYNR